MNALNQPNNSRIIPSQIDIKTTTATLCDVCGGQAFQEAIVLRKVSALLSQTGKEGYLPVQTFCCVKCGNVNQQFLPEELKSPKISS